MKKKSLSEKKFSFNDFAIGDKIKVKATAQNDERKGKVVSLDSRTQQIGVNVQTGNKDYGSWSLIYCYADELEKL